MIKLSTVTLAIMGRICLEKQNRNTIFGFLLFLYAPVQKKKREFIDFFRNYEHF